MHMGRYRMAIKEMERVLFLIIHCTKKLLKEMKVKPEELHEEDSLFGWHANFLTINDRNTVVLVNNKNRYTVILYGLEDKDFKNLDKLVPLAIREIFEKEGFRPDLIDLYLEKRAEISFTKTKNRQLTARMSKTCEDLMFFTKFIEKEKVIQHKLSKRMSRLSVGDGKNSYILPHEEMYKHLEEFYGRPIFNLKAAEIKVKLDLKNHFVWRKLVVPLHLTFDDFHEVIQAAFGWENSHLHQFIVFENGRPVYLVQTEEAISHSTSIEMKVEKNVQLSDYIPDYEINYVYDLGDNWKHIVQVERVLDNYDKNFPILVDGAGVTPPEDIGGEVGFENLLSTIAGRDKHDSDHLSDWAESQINKEFDLEKAKRAVRQTLG